MTHKELKETGWREWLEDKEKFTDAQLEILRSAYEYGWYNAYGLKTEDKHHKKTMEMLKELKEKLDS